MLTAEEVAKQLDISTTTVHQFVRTGLLKRHLYGNNHRCLYEPPGDVKLVKGVRQSLRQPPCPVNRRSNQPNKVQYEVNALSRGCAGRAASTAQP